MNANRFRLAQLTSIALATLALAACGGGGDSPPPAAQSTTAPAPAPTAPTATTSVDVPQDVRSVAASSGSDINSSNYASLGRSLGGVAVASTGNPMADSNLVAARERSAALVETDGPALSDLPAWIEGAAANVRADAERERAAALKSSTVTCARGGTLTSMENDADDNHKLSAGDSVTLVMHDCANDVATVNGSFELGVNAVELNSRGEATAIDASGRFIKVRGNDSNLDGAFRIWAKSESATSKKLRLSMRDVEITHLSDSAVINIDMRVAATATTAAMSIDGGFAINGQTYSLTQLQPFTIGASGVPTGGSLRLTDAKGDAVLMRVTSGGRVNYDFVPAGSSAPADTTSDPGWTRSPTPKR